MKKVYLGIAGLVVVALLVGGIYLFSRNSAKLSPEVQAVNAEMKIAGLQIGMPLADVTKLLGSDYEKIPCVVGDEYDFPAQNLGVIVDFNKNWVKKITCKNPDYQVYGLTLGMDCQTGGKLLAEKSFQTEGGSTFKYVLGDVRITMLSLEGQLIDGFVVETITDF